MHETKWTEELVCSKLEFEDFTAKYNVKIKNIRANNGIYTAKLFQESFLKKQQSLTFCAVSAHWQNGIAEWFIGSNTQNTRTILLYMPLLVGLVSSQKNYGHSPFIIL